MKTARIQKAGALCIVILALLLGLWFAMGSQSGGRLSAFFGMINSRPAHKETIKPTHLESNIRRVLTELEVADREIVTSLSAEDGLRKIEARIPRGLPIEWIVWGLSQSVKGTSSRVADCVWDASEKKGVIRFKSNGTSDPAILLLFSESPRFFSGTAKMAILIENFHFKADQTTIDILSFPAPLTVSLPAADSTSIWTAQAANEYNKEIVIQLPLEPMTKIHTDLFPTMIMVHYPEEKIRQLIGDAVRAIPHFSGFINRLGSRACEDSRVVKIVLGEVRKHHAYFIEKKTARNSVIPAMAEKMSVPYRYIEAVVEENATVADMTGTLKHLCYSAQKTGSIVVGAAAVRPFIQALNETSEFLERNGVRLVYVSEIVDQWREK